MTFLKLKSNQHLKITYNPSEDISTYNYKCTTAIVKKENLGDLFVRETEKERKSIRTKCYLIILGKYTLEFSDKNTSEKYLDVFVNFDSLTGTIQDFLPELFL